MRTYLTSPACWVLFLGALLATLILTPIVIRASWKIGAVDRGGYRKINGRSIPLMGGLAVVIPLMVVYFLGILQPTKIFTQLNDHYKDLALLGAGGMIIAILGVIDDIRGLGAKEKFVVQIFVALLVCLAGKALVLVQLPMIGTINMGALGGMLLTIVWVVGMINAFNLVDGVDGLASGLALVSSVGLGIVAAMNGQTMVVLICLGLTGSLIGFLVFNFHPARIFLGDTGSQFLGYTLATLALLGASRTSGSVMLLTPMLALGFPIFDTLTSMARRILRGRNPFVGDRSHTHHRLLDYGYSQRQVALILYSVALMCTVSAVLCQVLYPRDRAPLFAVALYALVVMAVAWVNGYLRLRHALRISRCRLRNNKLDTFSRFASLSLKTDTTMSNLREIMRVGCKELRLCYLDLGIEFENEEDAESILSVNIKGNGESKDLDPIESLRVHDALGNPLLIRFQVNHRIMRDGSVNEDARETDKLEHQDIVACLANLFSKIDLTQMLRDSPERSTALRSKMAVVHDISSINNRR